MITTLSHYHRPDMQPWQGRPDAPPEAYFFQIVQALDLTADLPLPFTTTAFALIGFCCDEGIRRNLGRPGAALGPAAIRTALATIPIQKPSLICYDAGDIYCNDGDLEAAQSELGKAIQQLLQIGITPIVIGGGHELAYGHYQGISKQHPNETLGIVNFDAHFDMRPLLSNGHGSSGTPFLQIALDAQQHNRTFNYYCLGIQQTGNTRQLFDTAKKHRVNMIMANDFHQGYIEKCVNFIDNIIDENQIIYLSICLDVLAASFAPGVSAPQALGLTPWHILPLIRQLAASSKVICYDIAEMSPPFDIDHRTAKLAANFIFEITHHHDNHVSA